MTTLLAVGDIHLGRTPGALHPDLAGRASRLGPEAAWSRAVAEAVKRQVDAVVLAGDVVERSRDLLVAYGDLKQGVEQLAAAGIRVLAVAGNHDTLVLPRLAREIDSLELLGADGRWQEKSVGNLSIVGWSFPRPQVYHSPLQDFPQVTHPERAIGLLHCDRDQSDSPYAPVSSAELAAAPTAAWLLGHIHQPDALTGERPIGYLGSISALRASDIGPRGPWLLSTSESGLALEQLPLAPLRYELLEIDVSRLERPDMLAEATLAASRSLAFELSRSEFVPDVVGLRISWVGRCRFERELPQASAQLLADSRPWQEHGITLFIQKTRIRTEVDFDLEDIAQRSDPSGLLARRLLILADPTHEAHQALLDHGRGRLQSIAALREFQALSPELDDKSVRDWLERAGQRALLELLGQRRGAG